MCNKKHDGLLKSTVTVGLDMWLILIMTRCTSVCTANQSEQMCKYNSDSILQMARDVSQAGLALCSAGAPFLVSFP